MRDLAVALGTSPTPITRELGESDETQSARIILLIAAPPRHAALYLQAVGAFARLLSRSEVVDEVLAQRDAASLATLPAFAEIELRDQLAVRDLMTHRPRSVSAETPLRDAALDMVRGGVAGLPVVDEGGRGRRDARTARAASAPSHELSSARRPNPAAVVGGADRARRHDAAGALRLARAAARRGGRHDEQQRTWTASRWCGRDVSSASSPAVTSYAS
jgi:CBS domain-containing protein